MRHCPMVPGMEEVSSLPVPIFISRFNLETIKITVSVRFTSSSASITLAGTESELLQAYEQVTQSLVLVDLADTHLTLGKLTGRGVNPLKISDRFMQRGSQDLQEQIIGEIVRSLALQTLVILATPKLLGNPAQIVRALYRVGHLIAMSF